MKRSPGWKFSVSLPLDARSASLKSSILPLLRFRLTYASNADSTINSTRLKFTSKTRVIRWLLTTGMRAAVQIYYIKQPVFYIPHGWVPGYFELLLAFPRAPKGSVSVQTWGLACASVVDLVVGKGVMKVLEEVAERRSQKTKVGVVKKL